MIFDTLTYTITTVGLVLTCIAFLLATCKNC